MYSRQRCRLLLLSADRSHSASSVHFSKQASSSSVTLSFSIALVSLLPSSSSTKCLLTPLTEVRLVSSRILLNSFSSLKSSSSSLLFLSPQISLSLSSNFVRWSRPSLPLNLSQQICQYLSATSPCNLADPVFALSSCWTAGHDEVPYLQTQFISSISSIGFHYSPSMDYRGFLQTYASFVSSEILAKHEMQQLAQGSEVVQLWRVTTRSATKDQWHMQQLCLIEGASRSASIMGGPSF